MTDTHNLIVQNRSKISVTGVTDVFGFDEGTVTLSTVMGDLVLKGKGLHVGQLSLQTGEVSVEGELHGLEYTRIKAKKDPFWVRLFR